VSRPNKKTEKKGGPLVGGKATQPKRQTEKGKNHPERKERGELKGKIIRHEGETIPSEGSISLKSQFYEAKRVKPSLGGMTVGGKSTSPCRGSSLIQRGAAEKGR